MVNVKKRLDELAQKTYNAFNMSEAERSTLQHEVEMLHSILQWLDVQIKSIQEGSYDSESKRLSFKMKNTTQYFFESIKFPLSVAMDVVVPISIYHWKPGQVKEIVAYYDYDNDINYKNNKTIRLSTNVEEIEFVLFNKDARKNTGSTSDEPYRYPKGYSEKQSYIVVLESFCANVPEIDLRAKGRMMLELLITVFDLVQKNHDLEPQINRLMGIYLPALRRTMHSYMEAVSSKSGGESVGELRGNLHKTLNVEIKAIKALIEKMHSGSAAESTLDLDVMKKFMEEEGLL